jgi:hypothetical protein
MCGGGGGLVANTGPEPVDASGMQSAQGLVGEISAWASLGSGPSWRFKRVQPKIQMISIKFKTVQTWFVSKRTFLHLKNHIKYGFEGN